MSEIKMPSDDRTADHLRDIYPANSKIQPPPPQSAGEPSRNKHLEKVTSSATSIKKTSIGKRILGLFLSEDAEEIKRYLKDDLIIPSIKTGILSALEMIFFHRTSGYGSWRPYDYSKQSQRQTNYSYGSGRWSNTVQAGENRPANGGVKSILYRTRSDAEAVLRILYEQIDMYGEVSVMQFYDASDIDSQFPDAKWGWTDLSSARIYPIPGGFTIQMPKPIYFE